MDFCSSKGKLKWRGYIDGRCSKTKTLPVMATTEDLSNPSDELIGYMDYIRKDFSEKCKRLIPMGMSPVKHMFESKLDVKKTAYSFFTDIADYRLAKFKKFISADLDWNDITDSMLMDYVEHLEDEDVANNTIRTYLIGLKSAIKEAGIRGYKITASDTDMILRRKISDSVSIYLTEEELSKIENVQLSPRLDAVRVKFLIGAYTGARYSDFSRLSSEDIVDGYIRYVAEKCSNLVYVPVHSKLKDLLNRFSDDVSVDQINRLMPVIAKMAGIDSDTSIVRGDKKMVGKKFEFVKSHTARRTFATNVYLSGEYDAFEISKFLGHGSVETTKKYIKCGVRSKLAPIWSYFK